jgi:hypothetical protein
LDWLVNRHASCQVYVLLVRYTRLENAYALRKQQLISLQIHSRKPTCTAVAVLTYSHGTCSACTTPCLQGWLLLLHNLALVVCCTCYYMVVLWVAATVLLSYVNKEVNVFIMLCALEEPVQLHAMLLHLQDINKPALTTQPADGCKQTHPAGAATLFDRQSQLSHDHTSSAKPGCQQVSSQLGLPGHKVRLEQGMQSVAYLRRKVAFVVSQPLLGAGVEAPAGSLKLPRNVVAPQVRRTALTQPEVLQCKAHKLQAVPERPGRAVVLVAAATVPDDAAGQERQQYRQDNAGQQSRP